MTVNFLYRGVNLIETSVQPTWWGWEIFVLGHLTNISSSAIKGVKVVLQFSCVTKGKRQVLRLANGGKVCSIFKSNNNKFIVPIFH